MTETRENKIESLRAAVLAGDAAQITQLQNELTLIEENTVANRAAEIHAELKRIDARLEQIKEEQAVILADRAEKNKILGAARDAVLDAQLAVNLISVAFMTSENEQRILHEDKYAANQQLKWLAEESAAKYETNKG